MWAGRVRVLGVEEGSFDKGDERVLLVAVVMFQTRIEDILFTFIQVDGLDATDQLIKLLQDEKPPINLILLHSIPYAGFNLMDPIRIHRQTTIPVVVVNPERPDISAVRSALLHHFPDWELRIKILEAVGAPKRLAISPEEYVFLHAVGISEDRAEALIRRLTVLGKRPEPLRVARILARELSRRYPPPYYGLGSEINGHNA